MNSNTTNTEKQPPRRAKNTSERQLAANRANAKKSTGPRTEEGKAVSRYNSLRYGLTCFMTCLPGEDKEDYEGERAEYYAYWKPATAMERGLVDAALAARWRIEHIVRQQNCVVREQMVRARPETEKIYEKLSPDVEVAVAIKFLCDNSNVLERLQRQEARLERTFQRSIKQLIQLKGIPTPIQDPGTQPTAETPQIEKLQNEPIPTNEHPIEDLEPIGNATAPLTIIMKPKVNQPELITDNCQLTTGFQLTTSSQLTTDNCQLTTPPRPLVLTAGAAFPHMP